MILNNERLPYDEQASDSESSDSSSESSDPDSPTELEMILNDIKQTISCLYKLAIVVHNPAPRDRFRKAEDIDTSHFELWDSKHIGEKFPMLASESPFLLQRLGKANSRRRQVFKYNKIHHSKMRHGVNNFLVRAEPVLEVPHRDLESEQQVFNPVESQDRDEAARSAPSISAPTLNTQTTATTFIETKTEEMDVDFDDALSESSSAVSENPLDEGALKIPEPPAGALDGDYFECPYCYEISRTPTITRWR